MKKLPTITWHIQSPVFTWQSFPCVLTFFTGQKNIWWSTKAMTKRVVWRKFYREFPGDADSSLRIWAERDRRKTDEHGFRAAHRTIGCRQFSKLSCRVFIARLRWDRPLQRGSADRHLLRSHPAREGRREVVTRFDIRLLALIGEQEGGFLCYKNS